MSTRTVAIHFKVELTNHVHLSVPPISLIWSVSTIAGKKCLDAITGISKVERLLSKESALLSNIDTGAAGSITKDVQRNL